jgi:transcriptional regulator with XRE-family HTH domain
MREGHLAKKTKKKSDSASKKPVTTSEQVNKIISKVGQKISGLRRAQGYSLQQLAARSDVSAPAIHKIERSGMVPTITTLLKLSAALGVPVNYFVQEDDNPPEPVHYTSSNDHHPVYTPHKGLDLSGITGPYQQFKTAAAVAQMKPGATSGGKLLTHPGEELVHVTSGEVLFNVGGQDFILKVSDSLHFSGEVPHKWANVTDEPAELIWVVLRNSI